VDDWDGPDNPRSTSTDRSPSLEADPWAPRGNRKLQYVFTPPFRASASQRSRAHPLILNLALRCRQRPQLGWGWCRCRSQVHYFVRVTWASKWVVHFPGVLRHQNVFIVPPRESTWTDNALYAATIPKGEHGCDARNCVGQGMTEWHRTGTWQVLVERVHSRFQRNWKRINTLQWIGYRAFNFSNTATLATSQVFPPSLASSSWNSGRAWNQPATWLPLPLYVSNASSAGMAIGRLPWAPAAASANSCAWHAFSNAV